MFKALVYVARASIQWAFDANAPSSSEGAALALSGALLATVSGGLFCLDKIDRSSAGSVDNNARAADAPLWGLQ